MIYLDIELSDEEKRLLEAYSSEFNVEIKIFCSVDEKILFHESGNQMLINVVNANRMIDVDGLVLLEEKSDVGNWNMGSFQKNIGYVFWAEYGDLATALKSL